MAPAPQPRLRIKLKLPAQGSSGGPQTAASTPAEEEEEEDEDEDEPEEPRRRRIAPRDDDVESEDSDDADDGAQSTRSTSVATTGTGARALTARQAVLANVVDSSHVSLDELPNPRKKKPLTEIEMALKREETARKRRNLTEKKLEDEKTETINRLLKKQSRAKGRRNALSTAEDRPTQQANADDMDDAADAEAPEPVAPTMFRWVSSSRVGTGQGDGKDDRTMALSFSVPVSVLPDSKRKPLAGVESQRREQSLPRCDVQGCTSMRKYRLVKDWGKGACGMSHLKMLEGQLA